jgi:hypothetical protein
VPATRPTPPGIDPRGPRFAAALTSVVLAVAVATGSVWLLAAQVVVFALGSLVGPTATPYAAAFRRLVRPRIGPPTDLEDPRPPRFAQTVGLVVTGTGVLAAAAGLPAAVVVAGGIALVAALLNAVFDLCLGCEVYLRLARLRAPRPI